MISRVTLQIAPAVVVRSFVGGAGAHGILSRLHTLEMYRKPHTTDRTSSGQSGHSS